MVRCQKTSFALTKKDWRLRERRNEGEWSIRAYRLWAVRTGCERDMSQATRITDGLCESPLGDYMRGGNLEGGEPRGEEMTYMITGSQSNNYVYKIHWNINDMFRQSLNNRTLWKSGDDDSHSKQFDVLYSVSMMYVRLYASYAQL